MGILLFLNRIRTREIINFAIPLDDFIRGRLEKAALKINSTNHRIIVLTNEMIVCSKYRLRVL